MVLVSDLEQWRAVAGAEALDFVECEHAVLCGLAVVDPEFVFQVRADLVRAAHVAREAGADLDHVFADRVAGVVHGVEGGDAFDFCERSF